MPLTERIGSICYHPLRGLVWEIRGPHDTCTPGLHTSHLHQELPGEVWKKVQSKDCAAREERQQAPREPCRVHLPWEPTAGQDMALTWRYHCPQSRWDWDTAVPRTSAQINADLWLRILKIHPKETTSMDFSRWISPCGNLHGDTFWRARNQERKPVMW